MIELSDDSSNAIIDRCPYCGTASQQLIQVGERVHVHGLRGNPQKFWRFYRCTTCGECIMVKTDSRLQVIQIMPSPLEISESVPERPRNFLRQAIDSRPTPVASVMVTASAVDSMLKVKGYKDDSLYSRINKAKDDHLITSEMAEWAHEIRLDANDQRHSDENADLPTDEDAKRCLDFALALAEYLFILPARVKEKRDSIQTNDSSEDS